MKGPKHNLKIAQTFFSFLRVNYQKTHMITVKTTSFPESLVHTAHTVHVNFSANFKFHVHRVHEFSIHIHEFMEMSFS